MQGAGREPWFMVLWRLSKLDYGVILFELRTVIRRGSAMRRFIVLAAAMSALVVASCNTVAGVGRDMKAAGSAVAGAAEDAKK